jgi:hypothetical protein
MALTDVEETTFSKSTKLKSKIRSQLDLKLLNRLTLPEMTTAADGLRIESHTYFRKIFYGLYWRYIRSKINYLVGIFHPFYRHKGP